MSDQDAGTGNRCPPEQKAGRSNLVTSAADHPQPGSAGPAPVQARIELSAPIMSILLGPHDEHLRALEQSVRADVHVRGTELTITGAADEVELARRAVAELVTVAEAGGGLSVDAVRRTVGMLADGEPESPGEVLSLDVLRRRGKSIRPKTVGQKRYVDAIEDNTVVFGIGPAGTGKTYLAMAKAVAALQAKQVDRIILTRPAVEAGERLGYLPGSLSEKIDPYLRPLYDALHEMMDPETVPKLLEAGVIEVAPLAYMRGRTLNDAFVVLDEAQNTTPAQMKMFLTRLGFGSTMVVTGDTSQIDLPGASRSGLVEAQRVLGGIDGIYFAELTSRDVVRHALVTAIVDAYDRHGAPRAPGVDFTGDRAGRRGRGERRAKQ